MSGLEGCHQFLRKKIEEFRKRLVSETTYNQHLNYLIPCSPEIPYDDLSRLQKLARKSVPMNCLEFRLFLETEWEFEIYPRITRNLPYLKDRLNLSPVQMYAAGFFLNTELLETAKDILGFFEYLNGLEQSS